MTRCDLRAPLNPRHVNRYSVSFLLACLYFIHAESFLHTPLSTCSCPEVTASEEVLQFLGCPSHLIAAAAELQQWSVAGEGSSSAGVMSRPFAGLRMMRQATAGVFIQDFCPLLTHKASANNSAPTHTYTPHTYPHTYPHSTYLYFQSHRPLPPSVDTQSICQQHRTSHPTNGLWTSSSQSTPLTKWKHDAAQLSQLKHAECQ